MVHLYIVASVFGNVVGIACFGMMFGVGFALVYFDICVSSICWSRFKLVSHDDVTECRSLLRNSQNAIMTPMLNRTQMGKRTNAVSSIVQERLNHQKVKQHVWYNCELVRRGVGVNPPRRHVRGWSTLMVPPPTSPGQRCIPKWAQWHCCPPPKR